MITLSVLISVFLIEEIPFYSCEKLVFFVLFIGLYCFFEAIIQIIMQKSYIWYFSAFIICSGFLFNDYRVANGQVILKDAENSSFFVFPFNLKNELMQRLIIIDFDNDPEYISIEPQFFDDPENGKGLRILLYRKDSKVDVYYEPGVVFDPHSFKIGGGLGVYVEKNMNSSYFLYNSQGIDLHVEFIDILNRKIEINIQEKAKNTKMFPFLAPVGKDVVSPDKLLLVYMNEFGFLKIEGTILSVTIGNRELIPAKFPIKWDGEKVFFARYSSNLSIGILNAEGSHPMISNLSNGFNQIGPYSIILDEKNQITSYWIYNNNNKIELSFEKGFPNLISIDKKRKIKGGWRYSVSGQMITGGTYSLCRNGDNIDISCDVTKKWKPKSLPLSFKIFTYIVRSFRIWPTTYKWEATLNLANYSMNGAWKRK